MEEDEEVEEVEEVEMVEDDEYVEDVKDDADVKGVIPSPIRRFPEVKKVSFKILLM